ncbi:hypothetical protein Avbf_05584 [Armadillidium vulgare]|nr:hypothetical protein Avbf_05584 [Armadillidium vulgare]
MNALNDDKNLCTVSFDCLLQLYKFSRIDQNFPRESLSVAIFPYDSFYSSTPGTSKACCDEPTLTDLRSKVVFHLKFRVGDTATDPADNFCLCTHLLKIHIVVYSSRISCGLQRADQ